jgi:hypothetical protein
MLRLRVVAGAVVSAALLISSQRVDGGSQLRSHLPTFPSEALWGSELAWTRVWFVVDDQTYPRQGRPTGFTPRMGPGRGTLPSLTRGLNLGVSSGGRRPDPAEESPRPSTPLRDKAEDPNVVDICP